MTSIGDGAFAGCSSLTFITIPYGVTRIGKETFEGCSQIESVYILKSKTNIGYYSFPVFPVLHGIKCAIIPDTVTSIGEEAFYGCYNLRKVEIPKSVESIGEKAFWSCPIKEVKLPPDTEYKPDSFDEVTKVVRAKVTISYSHDSEEHKAWVRKLAKDLVKNGVEVLLDQWELRLGKDKHFFMEKAISNAERVICIMTSNYRKKTENLEGGVGYEYSIIKGEISENLLGNKFLPILREGSYKDSCPIIFKDKMYLDFRRDDSYENSLNILLREIFRAESIASKNTNE